MNASIGTLLTVVVYSIALPAGLAIWWKRKTGETLWCFLAGACCFLLFAMVLEQILHTAVLLGSSAVSRAIQASPALTIVYAALAAGVFEETGRMFGFRVLLRNHREKECAVAYGIGHGGMEVILVLGISYLVYLLASCGIPLGEGEAAETILQAASSIRFSTAGIAMFERISAMMAHIGLSMMVFVAARRKGMLWLYPAAVLLHALLDVPAAFFQLGILRSLWVVEGSAFVAGLVYLLAGWKLLNRYSDTEPEGNNPSGEAPEALGSVPAEEE